jgi:hypothetical protein
MLEALSFLGMPASAPPAAPMQAGASVSQTSVTLPSPPTAGRWLVAAGFSYASSLTVNAGWTEITALSSDPAVFDPGVRVAYKAAGSSESATQTPFTLGGADRAICIWEIAETGAWADIFENGAKAIELFGSTSKSVSHTTTRDNSTVLLAACAPDKNVTPTLTPADWTTDAILHTAAGGTETLIQAHRQGVASGTAVTATATWGVSSGSVLIMLTLAPPP